MKDWFFYQERGQTMGPITIEEMRSRIRQGELRPFDLIYREGEKNWRMAFEHPDVRDGFKGLERRALKGRPWVCLRRKKQEGFDFVTAGPFAEEEVREHIRAGKLSYNDYAWQEGFTEWRRLGSLPEFNDRAALPPEEPPPIPEVVPKSKDLLKNVVELKRATFQPIIEKKPTEADGPDLTKAPAVKEQSAQAPPPLALNTKTKGRKVKSAKGAEAKNKKVEVPPLTPKVAPPRPPVNSRAPYRRSSQFWRDWGLVLGIAAVLMGTLVFFLLRAGSKPKPIALAVSEPLPDDAEDTEAVLPDSGRTAPQNQRSDKKTGPPTQLSLSVQGNRSEGYSRVEVRSNASAEFPVFLQIVGVPGQVSSGGAFYRYIKLVPTGDFSKPLDLGGLKLPLGKFALRAETGTLRKEVLLSLGTLAPEYPKAVARQRKFFAAALWSERLTVYRMSQALEKSLSQALSGGHWAGRGFEALTAVNKSNGGNYLFFEDWWELKQIHAEAKKRIHPSLVERARRVRERMAGFTVWRK